MHKHRESNARDFALININHPKSTLNIWRFEASQSMYLTSGDEEPLRWIPLVLKAEDLPTFEEVSRILRNLPLADSLS